MKIIKQDQSLMIIQSGNIIFLNSTFFIIIVVSFIIFITNSSFTYFLSGFLAIITAILFALLTTSFKVTNINIDKNTNKLIFNYKKLISRKIEEYNLNSVKQIEIGFMNITFVLDSGEKIKLVPLSAAIIPSRAFIFFATSLRENVSQIGKSIADFINVPFLDTNLKIF